ncbi:MAG TPA: SRPBCC family protein [Bacteroidia bacterium]|nr:SRPBCC family protein [Bacteroidia bacterium]
METKEKTKISIEVRLNIPLNKAWDVWTKPEHIVNWNFASEDWQCPKAEVDLRVGGKFTSRMEAKDGSFGFDFSGEFDKIKAKELLEYTLEDGRKVKVEFREESAETIVNESFEPENENPLDMQRQGWQMILNNYKKYAETLKSSL